MTRRWFDFAAGPSSKAVSSYVALFVGVLGAPSVAHAQLEVATSSVVALSRQPTPDVLEKSFFDALRSHLKELGIALEVVSAPRTSDPLAIASSLPKTAKSSEPLFYTWLAQYPPRVIVYLYEPYGPHLGARESTLGSSTAATSEELALILRSAILARRSGGSAELDEVDLVPSAPTLEVDATKVPPSAEDLSARKAGGAHKPGGSTPTRSSEQSALPNFGAAVGVAYEKSFSHSVFRGGLHTRLWIGTSTTRIGFGYLATPTALIRTDAVDLLIERRPFDLFFDVTLVGQTARVTGELRFVADPLRRRTLTTQSPLEPDPAQTRWTYAFGPSIRSEVTLTPGLAWTLWVGADVVANPFPFEVKRGEERETITELLTVCPVLGTGLLLLAR